MWNAIVIYGILAFNWDLKLVEILRISFLKEFRRWEVFRCLDKQNLPRNKSLIWRDFALPEFGGAGKHRPAGKGIGDGEGMEMGFWVCLKLGKWRAIEREKKRKKKKERKKNIWLYKYTTHHMSHEMKKRQKSTPLLILWKFPKTYKFREHLGQILLLEGNIQKRTNIKKYLH